MDSFFFFLDNRRLDLGELFENFDNITAVKLEQGFKQLKNAMDKQVRTWWDITTLGRYRDANITPRRLRWDVDPNDGLTDEELAKNWYSFFNDCENKLLNIIIKRREEKANQNRNQH